MTSPDSPVGACGDAAPTGDPATRFPARYRNGQYSVETATLRREKAELLRTVEVLLAALDGGEKWEIDHARHLAARELNHIKDQT